MISSCSHDNLSEGGKEDSHQAASSVGRTLKNMLVKKSLLKICSLAMVANGCHKAVGPELQLQLQG